MSDDVLPTLRERASAIALVYATTALPGFLFALPMAGSLGVMWGDVPGGDALLWEPGGAHLLESVRTMSRELAAASHLAPWLALGLTTFALVPWSALLVVLSRRERIALPAAMAVALARFPTMLALFGVTTFARTLVALGSLPFAGLLVTFSKNEKTSSLAGLCAFVLAAFVIVALGVLHDLARAAAIRHGSTAVSALLAGLATARARPLALSVSFLARGLAGLAVVLSVAWLVGKLGVSRAPSLVAVGALHQIALLAVVLLRASWLRVAIEAVSPSDPARLDGETS